VQALLLSPASLPSACTTVGDCEANLTSVLPDVTSASSRSSKRVTRRLAKIKKMAYRMIGRGTASSGNRQARLFSKARTMLTRLLDSAHAADTAGTLGVPLAPIEAAVNALLAALPAA